MANDTDPVFFYSTDDDTCSARGFSFNAVNNTANGGLCASISAAPTRDLWACPAPDEACWTIAKPCFGGDAKTPGDQQIACNKLDKTWCCNAVWEVCSGKAGQTNVCWAKTFENPLKDVDPVAAASIGSSNRAASQTNALNSRLSVLSSQATATSSITTTGSLVAPTGGGSSVRATGSTLPSTSSSHQLSRGAIAGAVIGCILGIALLLLAGFLVLRHRKRQYSAGKQVQELSTDSEVIEKPVDDENIDSLGHVRQPPGGQVFPVELETPRTPSNPHGWLS